MAFYWFEIRFDTELPGSTPGAMNTDFLYWLKKNVIAMHCPNFLLFDM